MKRILNHVIAALAALLGLIFGSFLNVVIARLPRDESIVTPGSKCPQCNQPLRWYDNIPLLSFVLLKARCRACGTQISWRYPAIELATAGWFVTAAGPLTQVQTQNTDALLQAVIAAIATAVLGWLLIGLATIDWQHNILPNELTLGGIFAGIFFACTTALFLNSNQGDVVLDHPVNINSANAGRSTGNIFLTGPEHIIFGRLFAAAAAFLLLYLIRAAYKLVRKRDGMGLGDAKLLAMIASFLGLAPTAVALAAGIFLATIYAVALLIRRTANTATRLPFGTFLAIGGLIAALYGQRFATAYLALFQ